MRTLAHLCFCVAVALGLGCITDYPVITDNDQDHDTGSSLGGGGNAPLPVNTNGRAHIRESSQTALLYEDGTDELFSFVDQKANGDQTLLTYNNHSGLAGQPTFHSDLYCNPDWQGCAIWTAPNPNDPGDQPFDGTPNENCLGFRSLSILVATGRYYGECGRTRLALEDRLALLGQGKLTRRLGRIGLIYDLDATNFSIALDNNAGTVTSLPFRGDARVWYGGGPDPRATVDLTNPLLGTVGRSYANWLAEHGTDHTTATLCYAGICAPFEIAGNQGPSTPERVMANMNLHY